MGTDPGNSLRRIEPSLGRLGRGSRCPQSSYSSLAENPPTNGASKILVSILWMAKSVSHPKKPWNDSAKTSKLMVSHGKEEIPFRPELGGRALNSLQRSSNYKLNLLLNCTRSCWHPARSSPYLRCTSSEEPYMMLSDLRSIDKGPFDISQRRLD